MESKKRGQYQKHLLGCDSIKNKEKLETDDDERLRLIKELNFHIDYLDKHGIRIYQGFSKLLKLYRIKKLNIRKFVEKSIKEINLQK